MPVRPPPVMVPNSVFVKPNMRFPFAQHGAANGEARPGRDQGQKTGPEDFAARLHRLSLPVIFENFVLAPQGPCSKPMLTLSWFAFARRSAGGSYQKPLQKKYMPAKNALNAALFIIQYRTGVG